MNMHWEIFGFIALVFSFALIGGLSLGYSVGRWHAHRDSQNWTW